MAKSIYIKGDIGISEDDEPTVTLEDVKAQNPAEGDTVYIDSRGGLISEGDAIYDLLAPLGVTTVNIGRCYSIATKIFLAGQKRIAQKGSSFMVHNPWAEVSGDADTLQEYAKELVRAEAELISFYTSKLTVPANSIVRLMAETTFIDAQEAVQMGLATEVEGKATRQPKSTALAFIKTKSDMSNETALSRIEALLAKYMGGGKQIDPKNIYTLTGADGETKMYVDAAPDDLQGKTLFVMDGEQVTEQPVAAGTYELSNGLTIQVSEEGVVDSVQSGGSGESEELARLKQENADLQAQLDEMKDGKAQAESRLASIGQELQQIKAQMTAGNPQPYGNYRKDPSGGTSGADKEQAENVLRAILGGNANQIKIK